MSCALSRLINRKVLSTKFEKYGRSLSQATVSNSYDLVVIGGGIIGTATANEMLKRDTKLKLCLVEKQSKLAQHQSGHNSGVIHAGIYYKPGSLKAKLCVEGMHLMHQFCDENSIPYKTIGKLIVATDDQEVENLKELHKRGLSNKVPDLELLESTLDIQKIEPACTGIQALWSPKTGIVDYSKVTDKMGREYITKGGEIKLNYEVASIKESGDKVFPIRITSKGSNTIFTRYVLACAGLYSDKIAEMTGCSREPRILPVRGEYLLLKPEKQNMVKCNIYPVPNPQFPFLGVHFTPRMDGSVWLGPNAVLAFKKEGYRFTDINFKEFMSTITYSGLISLASKHFRWGCTEFYKSLSPGRQVKDLQKFIPDITKHDVEPGPAGVRAQAVTADGTMIEDFYFDVKEFAGTDGKVLHCRNAPSPAATSSLAIAKMLVDKMEQEFDI